MPGPIRLSSYACWMVILGLMVGLQCVKCELIIIRKVKIKDVYHRDRFNIPRSICTDIRQGNKCAVYGGFERSSRNPCKCLCSPLMGTMSLQRNRWKCTGNAEVRQREGCGFYFPYESSKAFIKMLIPNQWQFIHAASSGCRLHSLNSTYLACNGSWLTSPKLARNIDVISRGFDQVARGYAYQVRVKKNFFLSGKMIKLGLTCRPFGGNPCLLLKIRGNQNCFYRKSRAFRKKTMKNKKAAKGLSSLSLTPSPSSQSTRTSIEKIPLLSNARGKPIPTNRKKDEDVTTLILTFAASLLGATVLALTINLFFCSSNQDMQKSKLIFRGRKNKETLSEETIPRGRAPSNASTLSSNLTVYNKLLSQESCFCTNKTPPSSNNSNTKLILDSTEKDSPKNGQVTLSIQEVEHTVPVRDSQHSLKSNNSVRIKREQLLEEKEPVFFDI